MKSRWILYLIGLAATVVLFTLLSVLVFKWGEHTLWFTTGLGMLLFI